jgi:mono/diheme cytochrome c family protein
MKKVFKILLLISASIAGLIVLLVIFINLTGTKTFNAPYPDISASNDSLIIERGKNLVFGPAHCASCHSAPGKLSEMDNGAIKPLIGGLEIDIPPATIRAINLTPDKETGIGNLSDGQIARALRYGIGHDGRMLMPVMEYSQMSDGDIKAIISYLRSQPPVTNKVEKTRFKFIGKALLRFGILKPKPFDTTPIERVSKNDQIAYGKYLATGVANCLGCHTNLDVFSGEFTVSPFAGGFYFEPDALTEGYGFVSPNLTPHTENGIISYWSEEAFIHRFKSGRVHATSPMPWGAFSQMDTLELRAIYQYLQTVDPVDNLIEKTVYVPGEKPK